MNLKLAMICKQQDEGAILSFLPLLLLAPAFSLKLSLSVGVLKELNQTAQEPALLEVMATWKELPCDTWVWLPTYTNALKAVH